MTWRDLFEWWNAIYSVPLIFALLYLTVTMVTGSLLEGAGALHHLGVDAAVDAEGVPGEASSLEGAHLSSEHEGDGHGLGSALLFLGVGRAPLTLVLQCLLLLWGAVGLAIHLSVGNGGPGWLLLSVPLSLVGSMLGTRALALAFSRLYRAAGTSALSRSEFVGTTGRVVYPVSTEEGTIHFRDPHGTLHRVRARSERERIEAGQDVIIVGYDPGQNVYVVDDAERFAHRRD
jgi:membrane protein implicated in regulation of membrane protease activity